VFVCLVCYCIGKSLLLNLRLGGVRLPHIVQHFSVDVWVDGYLTRGYMQVVDSRDENTLLPLMRADTLLGTVYIQTSGQLTTK